MAKTKELTQEEILSGFQKLSLEKQLDIFDKMRTILSTKKALAESEFKLIQGANIEVNGK